MMYSAYTNTLCVLTPQRPTMLFPATLRSTNTAIPIPIFSEYHVPRRPVTVLLHHRSSLRSGGTLSLEKPKPHLDLLSQPTNRSNMFEPEFGDGDDGGDKGNSIGGGHGGGGDDDDRYLPLPGDGDDNGDPTKRGLFDKRMILPEVFNRETVNAVLSEWMKTAKDLPSGLRSAYEMGLLSSAQFTRFMWFHGWPSFSRYICRSLPQNFALAFNGRIIVDPAFPLKFLLHVVVSTSGCVWSEFETRGKDLEKFKKDISGVSGRALTVAATEAFMVWSLAPCRFASLGGSSILSEWSNALCRLPNNAFEKGYKYRAFDLQKRAFSFFAQGAKLFAFAAVTKAAELAIFAREERVSSNTAVAFQNGMYYALRSNFSNQVLFGVDRMFVEYFDNSQVALLLGSIARVSNAWFEANKVSKDACCEMGNFSLALIEKKWQLAKDAITGISLGKPNTKRPRRKRALLRRQVAPAAY